jgi:hypothetical protein
LREILPLDASQAEGRACSVEEDRKDRDTSLARVIDLFLHPVGFHGRGRPRHDDAACLRELRLDTVAPGCPGLDGAIPEYGAKGGKGVRKVRRFVDILARVAEEDVGHERMLLSWDTGALYARWATARNAVKGVG